MVQEQKQVICLDNETGLYLVIFINNYREEEQWKSEVRKECRSRVFEYDKDNIKIAEYLWRDR